MNKHSILAALLLALASSSAVAAPVLRADVSVVGAVVTVGDMFADAGTLAEKPLFRAPAPGTSGSVGLDSIRAAAAKAGLAAFDSGNLAEVQVSRQAAVVDAATLSDLIAADLTGRGLVPVGAKVETRFAQPGLSFNAEAVAVPAQLVSLRYQPGTASFAARFAIAGVAGPVDVTGNLEMMVEVPHLAATLKAGTVLSPSDIEMKKVPYGYADTTGVDGLSDLVGKELRHNARAGLMLKSADVMEPLAVHRNTQVSVLLHSGPMTLTVIGQALGDASVGQPVQVMNSVTRKVLNGVAAANGTVEIPSASSKLQLAKL